MDIYIKSTYDQKTVVNNVQPPAVILRTTSYKPKQHANPFGYPLENHVGGLRPTLGNVLAESRLGQGQVQGRLLALSDLKGGYMETRPSDVHRLMDQQKHVTYFCFFIINFILGRKHTKKTGSKSLTPPRRLNPKAQDRPIGAAEERCSSHVSSPRQTLLAKDIFGLHDKHL